MKRILTVLILILMALSFACAEDSVLFINVGKADAILITSGGRHYLVDTGSQDSFPQLWAGLKSQGVETLSGVFLTHSHKDHVGGLEQLAKHMPIDMGYCAQIGETNKKGALKTQKEFSDAGLPVTLLSAGEVLKLSENDIITVLAPFEYFPDDDNDNSLVLLLTLGGVRYLLTGDMQYRQEATLLAKGFDLSAQVLKVGNHGNRDATSDVFARAVSPDIAVISTDRLVDFDSAHERVLAALQPARVFLTEDSGIGILVQKEGEELTAQALFPPKTDRGSFSMDIDIDNQLVTITGQGDLSGCILFSTRGGEAFIFPEGVSLKNGESITLSSKVDATFHWDEKNPIHKTKDDLLMLYHQDGTALTTQYNR